MIRERRSFKDIDILKTAYIEYEFADEVLTHEDFHYGEERTIVLRNKETNELERITFRFSGSVMNPDGVHYQWFFGDIVSDDYNSCLVFDFDSNGDCTGISATFCGKSITDEKYDEITKNNHYPAQFTKYDIFGEDFKPLPR